MADHPEMHSDHLQAPTPRPTKWKLVGDMLELGDRFVHRDLVPMCIAPDEDSGGSMVGFFDVQGIQAFDLPATEVAEAFAWVRQQAWSDEDDLDGDLGDPSLDDEESTICPHCGQDHEQDRYNAWMSMVALSTTDVDPVAPRYRMLGSLIAYVIVSLMTQPTAPAIMDEWVRRAKGKA